MSNLIYWNIRAILSAVMESPLWYKWTPQERYILVMELLPDF